MPKLHAAAMVAVIALVTIALRFRPFLIFGENRKTPPLVAYLGKVLPYAIMGMLVVYCLKDVRSANVAEFFPALIACLVVGGLYVWKRNTLISIIAGTVSDVIVVQVVF